MTPIPGFHFPLSSGLFRLACRGLDLEPEHRALDLLSGSGAAALELARETGCEVLSVDSNEPGLREAREWSRTLGLQDRVTFRSMDPQRLDLPARHFDAVLAVGGAPTVLGRPQMLERAAIHLVPGGRMLLADLVYLNSDPPAAAGPLLRKAGPDGEPLEVRSNVPEPIVRVVFEQGRHQIDTESDYRQLLEALGYEVEFSFLVPESEWAAYFDRSRKRLGDGSSEHVGVTEVDGMETPGPDPGQALSEEAAAMFAYGGRATVGYMVLVARYAALDN